MMKRLACLGIAMLSTKSAAYADDFNSSPFTQRIGGRKGREVVLNIHKDGRMTELSIQ